VPKDIYPAETYSPCTTVTYGLVKYQHSLTHLFYWYASDTFCVGFPRTCPERSQKIVRLSVQKTLGKKLNRGTVSPWHKKGRKEPPK